MHNEYETVNVKLFVGDAAPTVLSLLLNPFCREKDASVALVSPFFILNIFLAFVSPLFIIFPAIVSPLINAS